jgi:hypothetical protein
VNQRTFTASVIKEIAMDGKAFTFPDNPEEDIYSDDDLQVKYYLIFYLSHGQAH